MSCPHPSLDLGSRDVSAGEATGRRGGDHGFLKRVEDAEQDLVREAMRQLRRQKPYLYAVIKAWASERDLRGNESTDYKHGVSRGFYSRLSRQLGIEPQTVRYRLVTAMEWVADYLNSHGNQKA